MAITTNNSIRVNPFSTCRFRVIIISTVHRKLAHGAPNDRAQAGHAGEPRRRASRNSALPGADGSPNGH
jgi:hypothetical protein